VEQVGEFGDTTSPEVDITFSYKQWAAEVRKEVSTFKITTCDTTGAAPSCSHIHVTAPLPQGLQGREVSSTASPGVEGFVNKLKVVCCGKPPFPPDWPPRILFRNDVSVVFVPYDSPRVRKAQSVDDLIDQDIGFVYVRKKPSPGGTATNCGPNGVWCPPKEEPFYNLRFIGKRDGIYYIELTKLGNSSQVVATLPVELVVEEPSEGREISIIDSIDSPNESALRIAWPNITITIKFPLPR
jgi:hypothetical protein